MLPIKVLIELGEFFFEVNLVLLVFFMASAVIICPHLAVIASV